MAGAMREQTALPSEWGAASNSHGPARTHAWARTQEGAQRGRKGRRGYALPTGFLSTALPVPALVCTLGTHSLRRESYTEMHRHR